MRRLLIAAVLAACSGAPGASDSPDFVLDRNSTSKGGEKAGGSDDEEAAPAAAPSSTGTPSEPTPQPTPEPTPTPTPPDPAKPALVNGDFSDGLNGWTGSGDRFALFKHADGRPRLTTYYMPKGDKVFGKLWQDIKVSDTASNIQFVVHGGDARVVLMVDDKVIQEVHGKRANSPEIPVSWSLVPYRGKTVRIMIDDVRVTAWGWIGAGLFEVR